MDQKSAGELQEHMLSTYYSLRIGLVAIGIALPIVLWLTGGFLCGVWDEPSLSAYYHTPMQPPPCGTRIFAPRDIFVGSLFATGICLYLYKGFSTKENVALNLAGVFAVLVALLPKDFSRMHGPSAGLFFLCIAYVSLFLSRDTLELVPEEKRALYAWLYFWTGLAMIVLPLAAFVLLTLNSSRRYVFWAEAFAVWAFAAYWITKTIEMRETNAERRALDAQLKRGMVPAPPPAQAGAAHVGGASNVILRKLTGASGEVEKIVPTDSPSAAVQSPAPNVPPRARS